MRLSYNLIESLTCMQVDEIDDWHYLIGDNYELQLIEDTHRLLFNNVLNNWTLVQKYVAEKIISG